MIKQLTNTQVWVHDQDEALAFYTDKLGLELREDVTVPELGNFRWLSVGVPGQPDVAITLMAVPGPPVFDEDTRKKILELVSTGLSNREVGSTLSISEHTAANHIRSILRKTGCANRTEAASYAHRQGLTTR